MNDRSGGRWISFEGLKFQQFVEGWKRRRQRRDTDDVHVVYIREGRKDGPVFFWFPFALQTLHASVRQRFVRVHTMRESKRAKARKRACNYRRVRGFDSEEELHARRTRKGQSRETTVEPWIIFEALRCCEIPIPSGERFVSRKSRSRVLKDDVTAGSLGEKRTCDSKRCISWNCLVEKSF